jgi:hypothetical protein
MSTRGAIGVRLKGKDILTYNHSDSYPTGLGRELLKELQGLDVSKLSQFSAKLQIVDSEAKPTMAQLKICYPYLREKVEGTDRDETFEETVKRLDDRNVGDPGRHWYKTLRQTQGTLKYLLAGLPYFVGGAETYVYDSGCEWAYIANLDTLRFEIYTGHWTHVKDVRGYQKVQKPNGRYAMGETGVLGNDYSGALLLEEIPFEELSLASDAAIERYCRRMERLRS